MMQFISVCLAPVNLPYTILLSIVTLYWITVILGAADLDLFGSGSDAGAGIEAGGDAGGELDVDGGADLSADAGPQADADLPSDGDVEVDAGGGADAGADAGSGGDGAHDADAGGTEGDAGSGDSDGTGEGDGSHDAHSGDSASEDATSGDAASGGAHMGNLNFEPTTGLESVFSGIGNFFRLIHRGLGLGQSPLTVFFSFFALSAWTISLLANFFMNNTSMNVAAWMFFPNMLVSFILAKLLSAPFGFFFRKFGSEHSKHENLIGKVCVIRTSRADTGFGQAEIPTKGAPLLLDVRTNEGISLKQGQKGLIIFHDENKDFYLIRPLNFQVPDKEEK